jgi:pimeloyl-ACP methyl ester carboxylesterase
VGERSFVEVSGGRVEVDVSPGDDRLPVIVFLHEGLGSIDLWRGFPADVGVRAGGRTVVVYSRHGYGRSAPAVMPRPVEYMHHEADVVLPELLAALGVERPVLVGHSDGASIGLLHAGAGHTVASLVCIAPHVFVEPESIEGVAAARRAFEGSDLAQRMLIYHDEPVATFRGWNDVWASDEFRSWNIEDRLPGVTDPVLVVQGLDDQYGTVEQVDRIEAGVRGRVERLVIDGAGHAPHLDERDLVADAVARFLSSG